jgi:hypothetical protein
MGPGAMSRRDAEYMAGSDGGALSLFLMAVLIAVGGTVGFLQFGHTPMLEPDSDSYIQASGIRGLGYPFFLSFLRSIGLPLDRVPWIQLALHLAVLPVLFRALRRATGSLWLTAAIVLLCYANPEVAKYHGKILSESLFLTVLILFISAFLNFLAVRSHRSLLLASFWVAVCVTIKPVGWAFVTLLGLVVLGRLFRRRGRIAMLAALLFPLLAVVELEKGTSYLLHGPDRASLVPLHVFAKAGMIDAAVPEVLLAEGPNAPLHRLLEQDAAAIRRLIDRAPSANIARHLTAYYEVFMQYRFGRADRQAVADERDVDAAMIDTGLERLRYGWRNYLRLTLRHYFQFWLLYDVSHPAYYREANAFIDREAPLPYAELVPALTEAVKPAGQVAVIARPAIAAAGVATALLAAVGLVAVFAPKSMPLRWRQAGLLALGLHGYCLLVALAGVGIPRYLLGVWPLLVCSLGIAVSALLSRRRSGWPDGGAFAVE